MPRFPGSPSKAAVALLVSVCLNVLLVTYVGTQWLEQMRPPLATAAPNRLMDMITRRLPSGDAEIFWRVYHSKDKEIAAAQSDYKRALASAADLVAQSEIDWEAVRRAVDEARDRRVKVGNLTISIIMEALPQISAEGRLGLIKPLRRR
jgi:uncharacterized membrane protein